ncbi:MAG: S9 family peptidase [Pyrinomonadaceae bacterium]
MNRNLSIILSALLLLFLAFAGNSQPYPIQQYLNIKSAGSPTFSPDGKQMVYLTNATGTSQIWAITLPGGTPKQLTNYDDNIGFVRWLPDGSGIIFGKAKGGDENTQFYWMKPDGSGVKALTDDPKVRHNFAEISFDGKTIYYASNKRNRNFFDVYSMELATGKEELLFQQDGNNDLAAVNSNGSKFIISRNGVEFGLDNNLYLIDAKTKQETLLTPHTHATQYGDVHFTADGIVFAHNDKREFYSLAQMRKKNAAGDDWSDANRDVKILDETNWDVTGIEMPQFGSVMAYAINRDGFSELYLRKYETGGKPLITTVSAKAEAIKLPAQGIVGGMTFSKDQSKLAFSFSSSTQNGDIWLYDLKSKSLTQVTRSDRAGIDEKSFVAPELIKFKTFDGREIPAWFYSPKSAVQGTNVNANVPSTGSIPDKEDGGEMLDLTPWIKKKGTQHISLGRYGVSVATAQPCDAIASTGGGRHCLKFNYGEPYFRLTPVIVSVHGGPEGQSRPGFNALFQYYLSRGYAILALNVRGSTGYGKTYTHLDDVEKREDSVKDLAASVEWLKTKGGADPKRIAVVGGSYGGYMTMAAITLYPDLWAAAVGTVAITNWETFLTNTSGYRRRQREVEYGRLDRDIDFLRRISPIRKIDNIKTPLFVISGKNDPRVPYTEGEQMVDALRKRGAVVEYKLYDDEGHGISKLKNRLDLYPRVADFLDKYMK